MTLRGLHSELVYIVACYAVRKIMSLQSVMFILAVVPFWAHCVSAATKCDVKELEDCMKVLEVLTIKEDLATAETDDKLSKTCGHLQDAMECVNHFTVRCFDKSQQEIYREMTSSTQKLLADLCTEGTNFRKQYLVYAGCDTNVAEEYQKCADNFLFRQEDADSVEMPAEERLRKSCCLFYGHKECTKVAVREKCGEEATHFVEHFVTQAGGPEVELYCSSFKYNSKDCQDYNHSPSYSYASSVICLYLNHQFLLFSTLFLSLLYSYLSNRY